MPKLQTNGAKQKRITYMILLLWAAVCFALLVVDWCCWAPNRLDADMASEQLLANLLAQEGGVMSTNWYYSTELRVLNTQLVMAPLFRLFPSWHTVRVVGSVVLILLYLAAWFWFGHSAKLKYSGLLGAGLLVLPYGALYRQYVLEGLYYIPHIAISFVVLGCAVRILRGGRRLAPAAGMVLFSFAAALGGPRQLFILNIPLTVAAALLCWLDAPPADTLRQKLANAWRTPGGALLVPTLAADAAALAGYVVNAKALAEKYHFQDQGYVAFTGLNLDRLQWFVNALLASFGWQEGKVFSLAALFNLAAAALILFCFVFSVRLVRGKARYPLGHRLVGVFPGRGRLLCAAVRPDQQRPFGPLPAAAGNFICTAAGNHAGGLHPPAPPGRLWSDGPAGGDIAAARRNRLPRSGSGNQPQPRGGTVPGAERLPGRVRFFLGR